ncbi:MAG: NAD(P)/FAD-dependent oxidoreductase, partial [Turicibacter sp.]|nr:NAD(P)/FAD-dependent oxidoreductase [Turicibacter sp.]
MESKKVSNLYFIGEVTDIDGDTGGYNIQAAMSMGYIAAKAINTN